MLIKPGDILGGVDGGRVLDVATGDGGFVEFLIEGLRDFTEISAIDMSDRGRRTSDRGVYRVGPASRSSGWQLARRGHWSPVRGRQWRTVKPSTSTSG